MASVPPDEIVPVGYGEPPPLIHPVPFAEVEVGDGPRVVTWVAIANDGGAVVVELESDTVRVVRPLTNGKWRRWTWAACCSPPNGRRAGARPAR